jgi:peptidyl-prolyl cis-trans isomerase C
MRIKPIRRVLGALALALPLLAGAQDTGGDAPVTLVEVDGFPVTNLHLALFASQTGRSPEDAEGQLRLLNELVNNFMVAQSPEGRQLAQRAEVQAALEVARARLIAQTFVRDQLNQVQVSDEQLRALYDERYGEPGKEYKARHILVETEQEAQAVIDALEQGADFADLARDRSIGPSKNVGGELGWFEAGQMVEAFSAATAELDDGSYSEQPVETQFGWHVILREDSREAQPPSYDTVKTELETEIRQQHIAEVISRIRSEADIEVQKLD